MIIGVVCRPWSAYVVMVGCYDRGNVQSFKFNNTSTEVETPGRQFIRIITVYMENMSGKMLAVNRRDTVIEWGN